MIRVPSTLNQAYQLTQPIICCFPSLEARTKCTHQLSYCDYSSALAFISWLLVYSVLALYKVSHFTCAWTPQNILVAITLVSSYALTQSYSMTSLGHIKLRAYETQKQ